MSEAWQSAWVEVLPDFSEFRNRANSQMSAILGGAAGGAGAKAGTTGAAAFGGSMLAGVGKLAGPIAGAIAALGVAGVIFDVVKVGWDSALDYIRGSVELGSALNESRNAVRVSFGEAADEIEAIGKNAATDFGLSEADFNALATQFSAFAQTIRKEDPAGFIEQLTGRGTDFASVFNIDVAEALRLFQSGLAGETEPLRRYGIDLSAASVEAYALANGIAAQGEPLSEAQKQQARYGLLLESTAKTAGDFQNTSGELANQQRILAARTADTSARFGEALLPALTTVMQFVNDQLLPIWEDFNRELGPKLGEALERTVPKLIELGEKVLPLVEAVLPGVIDYLARSVDAYGRVADIVLEVNRTVGRFVIDVARNMSEFARSVGDRIGDAITWFRELPGRIRSAVGNLGSTLYSAGQDVIRGLASGITSMFSSVVSAITDTVGGAIEWAKDLLGIASPSKVFAEIGEQVGAGYTVGLKHSTPGALEATTNLVRAPKVTAGSVAGSQRVSLEGSTFVMDVDGETIVGVIRKHAAGEVKQYDHAKRLADQRGYVGDY